MTTQLRPQPEPGYQRSWHGMLFWLLVALNLFILGSMGQQLYLLGQYFDIDPLSQLFALAKIQQGFRQITWHLIGLLVAMPLLMGYCRARIYSLSKGEE